jgi:hypothetical protein
MGILRKGTTVGGATAVYQGGPVTASMVVVNGRVSTVPVATPGAPTVTPTGTAGATTYYYWLVATDRGGGKTLVGPAGSTTTGNAVLSAINYNRVSWTAVPNAYSYDLLRTTTASAPTGTPTALVASGIKGASYDDVGTALTAYAMPTFNTTADLTLGGDLFLTPGKVHSNNAIAFYTNGSGAQAAYARQLLASDVYSDASLLPTNGVYSKGQIKTAGGISLSGATSNTVDWGTVGSAAPTFTTRSNGTKVVLYSLMAAATVDHAIGVESGHTWFTAPQATGAYGFKWYGGTTLAATLNGLGDLTLVRNLTAVGGAFTGKLATAASAAGAAGLNVPHGAAPTAPVNGDVWTTTGGAFVRVNGVTQQLMTSSSGAMSFSGKVSFVASTTSEASFNVPHGATPTAPVNGDVWTTSTGAFVRIGGATQQLAQLGSNLFTGSQYIVNSILSIRNDNAVTSAFTASVTGEPYSRFSFMTYGRLEWSSGADASDVWLERSAASTLGVSANLSVGSALTVSGKTTLAASTTSAAGLNLPHGAAPTAPVNGDLWTTTGGTFVRINGATRTLCVTSLDNSFNVKQTFVASATGAASVNLPHGAAPSAPVNGDVWTTTGGVFVRVNGTTQQVMTSGGSSLSFGSRVGFAASTAGASSINIAAGITPTVPVEGDIWNDGTSLMMFIEGEAKQVGSGGAGAMLSPQIVAVSDGVTDEYVIPGEGQNPWVIHGDGQHAYVDVDFQILETTPRKIKYLPGKIPAKNVRIAMSASTAAISGSNAATLGGNAPSTLVVPNAIVQRKLDGGIELSRADLEAVAPVSLWPVHFGVMGKPLTTDYIYIHKVKRAFKLPAGLPGSSAYAVDAASTAAKTCAILKNGTAVGSVNFGLGANDGTFTFASEVTFNVDDLILVTPPATQDATLANFGILLEGVLV